MLELREACPCPGRARRTLDRDAGRVLKHRLLRPSVSCGDTTPRILPPGSSSGAVPCTCSCGAANSAWMLHGGGRNCAPNHSFSSQAVEQPRCPAALPACRPSCPGAARNQAGPGGSPNASTSEEVKNLKPELDNSPLLFLEMPGQSESTEHSPAFPSLGLQSHTQEQELLRTELWEGTADTFLTKQG